MKYNFDEIIDRTGTSCVKWDLAEKFFGGKELLPMWVADMDFRTPGFITRAVKDRANHEIYGYTVRPDSYYQSFINWVKTLHNWEVEKDWILFSPGIVPAVNIAVMAYTNPGDKVIVQPPVYFPFFSAVRDNGRQLVYNRLKLENGRYNMDFDDLRKKIDNRTKMIIISNPHNPGGSAWTNEELTKLAEICMEKKVLIISDEIHSDLVLPGFKHTVLADISEAYVKQTITMMAPSKTFNLAGMATSSVIISDPDLRNTFNTMLERVHIGMGNIFGAVASEAAYTHGAEWRKQLLDYVQQNIDFVDQFIQENIPRVKMMRPEATYMIWLDFRELKLSDDELKNFIIHEAKLGFNDGPVFGPGGEGFQRMNVACPRSIVEQGMKRLKKAVNGLS